MEPNQQSGSPILTGFEAARWLRLDVDHRDDADAMVAAVLRLVRDGKLRPLRAGKSYKFTLTELERFAREETAAFTLPEGPETNGQAGASV